MTSLILMYVYFDKNGDIKAITPSLDEAFSRDFSSATFPLSDVGPFLTAQKNTFDYTMKKSKTLSGVKFQIVRKFINAAVYTRTLDNYLTKIDENRKSDTIITIINDTFRKVISITLDAGFADMYNGEEEEQQEIVVNFRNSGMSNIYITEKNNPYHLLTTFTFSPELLFSGPAYLNYTGTYTGTSAYTKKIIGGYLYREIK